MKQKRNGFVQVITAVLVCSVIITFLTVVSPHLGGITLPKALAFLETNGYTAYADESGAINTENILPQLDSTYDIGAIGNEYATGYYDQLVVGGENVTRSYDFIIATSDASNGIKKQANYTLNGTNDTELLESIFEQLEDFGGLDPVGCKRGSIRIIGRSVNLESILDLPPFHNFILDARDVNFAGAGIRCDSMMDAWLYFGVIDATNPVVGGNNAFDIDPHTIGPDNTAQVTNSRIFISAIAGKDSYSAGSTGIRIRADNGGTVQHTLIEVNEIFGFERLISLPNPTEGHSVTGITMIGRNLHDANMALREGDYPLDYQQYNTYYLNICGGLDYGVVASGRRSTYNILEIQSPTNNQQLHIAETCLYNTFNVPYLVGLTDIANSATNKVNTRYNGTPLSGESYTIRKCVTHSELIDNGDATAYIDFDEQIIAGSIIQTIKVDYTEKYNSDSTSTLTMQVGTISDPDAFNLTPGGENAYNTDTDNYWGQSDCQNHRILTTITPRILFIEDDDVTNIISGSGAQGIVIVTITYIKA